MDFWEWFIYIILALIILWIMLRTLAGPWLGKHLELVTQRTNDRVAVSPDIGSDLVRSRELEEQSKYDPKAVIPLIEVYERILTQWEFDYNPVLYAALQSLLGDAYRKLPIGNRVANIAQAITCYQEALRFLSPETEPSKYAGIQMSLGNAYSDLPTGDRAHNLAQAIACYQEALRFLMPETALLEYARAHGNLGNAYSALPTGNQATNLAQAITCYQEALRFLTSENMPLDYATAQNNLGKAYQACSGLPQGSRVGTRAHNLTQAITCYQEALRFRTPEAAPFDYATTQINLGAAYCDLSTGDRTANVAQAIVCFQEALRFLSPEIEPRKYALALHNLGNAYGDLPTGNQATNLAQAITCYQEALRFRTPEAAPFECRRTNRNLADLYFAQKNWEAALSAYHAGMEAGEQLYRSGLSTESKAVELAENAALYRHIAFTTVHCRGATEALLMLERGKTRLLTEAFRLHAPRPGNIPDEVWIAFEHASVSIRAIQFRDIAMLGEERDLVQAYAVREQVVQAANASLDAAIERVRVYAPDFLRAIDLSAIHTLLYDKRTVLIAFCITEQGSMAFVVGHSRELQVVEVPNFTQTELRRLLIELDTDGDIIGGWLDSYIDFLDEPSPTTFDMWQTTMTSTLAIVGQRLLAPILDTLPSEIEGIIFLPTGDLFLLPLHAVALSDNDSDQICDHYRVSYVPSIEVLVNIQAKIVQAATPDLYAVINPEADPQLIFTSFEGAAIARLFAQCAIDEGRTATKQRAVAGMHGRRYVHFSCHGSYQWDDPTVSGLILADGSLSLADLQRGIVDLSTARLVTLSACETGITDIEGSPEEYIGLPVGFLLAGVPCVVSSLWVVPELSTALLMERFYHNHLSNGMDIVDALRKAQLWVRELKAEEVAEYAKRCYQQSHQGNKKELLKQMLHYHYLAEQNPTLRPFMHPYYWAAFTVTGM